MKVVILAGGFGTRISEETVIKPKPMVEIGENPILWHIMKIYSSYGFNEFVILLGYKGYYIKEYFSNYFLHQSDVTIDMTNNHMEIHNNEAEPWKVTLLETGIDTMTGGRIKQAQKYLEGDTFLLTYGDGLSNININTLVDFHKSHGKKITMTAVQPDGRFGSLNIEQSGVVSNFKEKPKGDGSWVNGGFFVCDTSILNYITDNSTIFEQDPLQKLAEDRELMVYMHHGFWSCMDSLNDKNNLSNMWIKNLAPWKVW